VKLRTIVLLTAALSSSSLFCKADPFGIASGYNLVTLGTVNSQGQTVIAGTINDGSEVTGRVASFGKILNLGTVGTNLVGGQLPDPYFSDSVFGGTSFDVIANGGSQGNIVINSDGSAFVNPPVGTFTFNGNGGSKGTLVTGNGSNSPLDFTALRNQLQAQSLFLASTAETTALAALGEVGTVLGFSRPAGFGGINPSDFVLYAGNDTLDIFTITAAQFANSQLDIHTNPGASPTIIINVIGALNGSTITSSSNGTLEYNEGQHFNSTLTDKIIFNFPDTQALNINGEFTAAILAPFAILNAGSDIDGTVLVAQLNSAGEIHNVEFQGNLPPTPPNTPAVPEPGTLALVGTGVLSVAGMLRRRKGLIAR
jgi:choice-of-anchor A domain-containing protein